jgi:uncharacterized membrane protein
MNADSSVWDGYRSRRRLFWFALLGYIPGVLALGLPLQTLLHSDSPMYVVAAVWMVLYVFVGNWMMSFPCPRCRQPFFRTWWYHNPLAMHCLHCGLPKWSEDVEELQGGAA